MSVHPLFGSEEGERRIAPAGRAATLSAQIVAEVRDALNERRLKPGDVIGSEKEIAKRLGVSRIVARDALRTLEALGVAEIKVGAGGGARVARGNPRLFADALAVQLNLAGATVQEILDAQRAIETLAAELAAENANEADCAKLRRLLDEGAAAIEDHDRYTRLCEQFHVAIAEASHNRVLVVQLMSLQHISHPRHNMTLTRAVAQRVLEAHRALLAAIEDRDPSAARHLMDDHVKMIRARRVAERREARPAPKIVKADRRG
jgi:GntR family transcriptional repressor for pyruvate dehydrogenase complex